MKMTKHIQTRMDQRCINEFMLEIIQKFGEDTSNGQRTILNKKKINILENWTRSFLKQLELMKKREGLTLVNSDECLITVFANNSYRKNMKDL